MCRPDRGCAGVPRAAAPFLLLTLGYLVLTLVPLSRVRAVGLLLGDGLLSGHTDGNVCPGLRRCPADAVSLCHHHWLPGMGGPAGYARAVFSGERVFLPVPVCRIYDAPFTLGCMAYVCRRYARGLFVGWCPRRQPGRRGLERGRPRHVALRPDPTGFRPLGCNVWQAKARGRSGQAVSMPLGQRLLPSLARGCRALCRDGL